MWILATDDHAIRAHKVFNRSPFSQKLRIRHHAEFNRLRLSCLDTGPDALGRPNRYCTLGSNDFIIVHATANRIGDVVDVLHIRGPIFIRWCPYRDENRQGLFNRFSLVQCKAQTAFS